MVRYWEPCSCSDSVSNSVPSTHCVVERKWSLINHSHIKYKDSLWKRPVIVGVSRWIPMERTNAATVKLIEL